MKTSSPERVSLPAAIGLHCALLSLASGAVSLAVAGILWWRVDISDVHHIGQHAGLFSAALGLLLAGIGFASHRRYVRGLAVVAMAVNSLILCLTIDGIFKLTL